MGGALGRGGGGRGAGGARGAFYYNAENGLYFGNQVSSPRESAVCNWILCDSLLPFSSCLFFSSFF